MSVRGTNCLIENDTGKLHFYHEVGSPYECINIETKPADLTYYGDMALTLDEMVILKVALEQTIKFYKNKSKRSGIYNLDLHHEDTQQWESKLLDEPVKDGDWYWIYRTDTKDGQQFLDIQVKGKNITIWKDGRIIIDNDTEDQDIFNEDCSVKVRKYKESWDKNE